MILAQAQDRETFPSLAAANDNRFATVAGTAHKLATACTTETHKTVSYDALGNLTRKTDVSVNGGYRYGENGAGPHQLTSIQSCNGCQNDAIPNGRYYYDANGNLSCVTTASL